MNDEKMKAAVLRNTDLRSNFETTQKLMKATEACAAIQEFTSKTADPLKDGGGGNPFTEVKSSGCLIL